MDPLNSNLKIHNAFKIKLNFTSNRKIKIKQVEILQEDIRHKY